MLATSWASAKEVSTMHSNVRALGMGDAFTAVTDDSSALFYNPAGLARVSGVNWKIFGIRAGYSGASAYKKMEKLKSDEEDEYADAISDMYGEHAWTGVGGESLISFPMIGFGVYNHTDALVRVDNPVNPQAYTSVISDYGYVFGFGLPMGFIHSGLAFKYIKRTGAQMPYGASFLADLDPDEIYNNVTGWGTGYGVDYGANIVIPTPILSVILAATWKNIGQIHFRTGDDKASSVPIEDNNVTAAAAVDLDVPLLSVKPSIELHHLTNQDLQLLRKINLGVEVGLPLISVRAGFHDGYYALGGGVDLGLFRVDGASYGVELGDYPGQKEDRRYMLEFTMELGVGSFNASGSKEKGGAGEKSKSSGRRRLKQRR